MKEKFDAIVVTNNNGGLFVKGKRYSHVKKLEVANKFFELFVSNLENPPTVKAVAKSAKVSAFFARKIMNEIKILGDIVDPSIIKKYQRTKNKCGKGSVKLELRDRKYILVLRTEKPERPNYNYVQELYKKYDKKVHTY